jgi:hypothetical protein
MIINPVFKNPAKLNMRYSELVRYRAQKKL